MGISAGRREGLKGKKKGISALKSRDTTCYQVTVFPGVTQKGQRAS